MTGEGVTQGRGYTVVISERGYMYKDIKCHGRYIAILGQSTTYISYYISIPKYSFFTEHPPMPSN